MSRLNKVKKYTSIVVLTTLISACASTQNQESTGEYIDNARVTSAVKAALLNDKYVKSLPISVTTYKGNVQLSGFVDDRIQANRAAAIARRVEGVKSVTNHLMLK